MDSCHDINQVFLTQTRHSVGTRPLEDLSDLTHTEAIGSLDHLHTVLACTSQLQLLPHAGRGHLHSRDQDTLCKVRLSLLVIHREPLLLVLLEQ